MLVERVEAHPPEPRPQRTPGLQGCPVVLQARVVVESLFERRSRSQLAEDGTTDLLANDSRDGDRQSALSDWSTASVPSPRHCILCQAD
jgi:hypothetical protein